MLTWIFLGTTVFCALGWLSDHLSGKALVWYIREMNIPTPSEDEIKSGCEWAVSHRDMETTDSQIDYLEKTLKNMVAELKQKNCLSQEFKFLTKAEREIPFERAIDEFLRRP